MRSGRTGSPPSRGSTKRARSGPTRWGSSSACVSRSTASRKRSRSAAGRQPSSSTTSGGLPKRDASGARSPLDVDQVEARWRLADREEQIRLGHVRVRAQRLLVVGVSDDAAVPHRDPLPVVLDEVVAHTSAPPCLWYLRIPSAAR